MPPFLKSRLNVSQWPEPAEGPCTLPQVEEPRGRTAADGPAGVGAHEAEPAAQQDAVGGDKAAAVDLRERAQHHGVFVSGGVAAVDTGRGVPLAIMPKGEWLTPLGAAPIDAALAASLQHNCRLLMEDTKAHEGEHAIEVQLPFLQRHVGAFTFVPIAIGVSRYAALEALGHGMAQVLKSSAIPVMIVASSDMNHYEPDDVTRIKDHKAIDQILALDALGLYNVVRNEDISMCGYGPVVAMLTALKEIGATRAELVRYATSGDTGGDRSAVVGYAGMIIS